MDQPEDSPPDSYPENPGLAAPPAQNQAEPAHKTKIKFKFPANLFGAIFSPGRCLASWGGS